MPPHLLTVPARPLRAGTARQAILACLLVSLLYPFYLAVDTWGLPFGRTVHIYADGREVTFRSFRRTVGDAVESAQVPLHPGDRTLPAARTFLWPGIKIEVLRAVPVTVRFGASTSSVRVAATTVGDALHVLGVTLSPVDRVYPGVETAVEAGMRITVERRAWRIWTEQRRLPVTPRVVADSQLYLGNRIVRSPGRPGPGPRLSRRAGRR